MKYLIALLTLVMTLSTGCSSITSTLSARQGYTAGVLTAAIYLDTKDMQSSEVQMAAKIAYAALVQITEGRSVTALDSIILEEIEALGGPVTLQAIATLYYNTAKDNLLAELGVSELDLEILSNFKRGVSDTLDAHRE